MIDVVIVTFDTREVTLACLERLDLGRPIVVDNGSTDGTAEAVVAAGAELVRLEQGVGFAEACNRGAARGDAPYVLFLNSDVLARPGAIARLAAALGDGVVAVGGRLVDPGTDRTQQAYAPQPFPTVWTLIGRVTGLEPRARPQADRETAPVDQPAGACLLVRRDVFEAAGGFDEQFWFWYEDVDLARRLAARGTLLHVGDAVFEHLGGGTFASWGRERGLRSRLRGIVRYAEVHLPRRERALLGAALALSGLARWVAFSLLRRPGLAAAWRDGARAGGRLARGAVSRCGR